MKSATPSVEIRYTLDGREPDASSPLYTGPVTIEASSYIRARAFRPGTTAVPFSTAGTHATVVSDARFVKQAPLAAASTSGQRLESGFQWELVDGESYFALFSHLNLPEVMPAVARGTTRQLLDVSMRRSDGPFGVRYSGYLDVPADGVWTSMVRRNTSALVANRATICGCGLTGSSRTWADASTAGAHGALGSKRACTRYSSPSPTPATVTEPSPAQASGEVTQHRGSSGKENRPPSNSAAPA